MTAFNIDSILNDLEQGAIEAAKQVATAMLQEAAADAKAFVGSALPSIGRYVDLLLAKQITPSEFKSLMLGLKDLAELNGLTLAGLAAIEVERTRNNILNAITSITIGALSKVS